MTRPITETMLRSRRRFAGARAWWLAVVCGLVTLSASGVTLGGDGERFLDGRWDVVRMVREGTEIKHPAGVKLTMEFRASDHTWSFIVKTPKGTHSESGTWRLNGSELITRNEAGVELEHIKVTVLGKDELEFRKSKERLLLKRM